MRGRRALSSRWLLAPLVLSVALARAAHAEPVVEPAASTLAQASARFAAGQAAYERGAFKEALAEFSASQALVASPNSRLYRARCLRELAELDKAYAEYAKVVLEAGERAVAEPRYAETQRAASAERAALRARVAVVTVTMPPDAPEATLQVGSQTVAPSAWGHELVVAPGLVEVRAEAPRRRAFAAHVELRAGEARGVTVELPLHEPALPAAHATGARTYSPFATPLRRWGFVSGAVGLAGLVTWGAFGAAASSRYDELKRRCLGRCDSSYADDVAAGRRESAVSAIGLTTGVVGLAAGAALYAADTLPLRAWLAPPRTSSAALGVELTLGGVALGGTF